MQVSSEVLEANYFVTQYSAYKISFECLLKHMRMLSQMQHPSTANYFLFLPNLLTWWNSHLGQQVALSSICHIMNLHS